MSKKNDRQSISLLKKKPIVFEGEKIRRHWDEKNEKWWFSVTDICGVLTKSKNPQVYWRVLKKRLIDEGSDQTVTKCNGLKMLALDGKMRLTDTADTETIFRIIQSIPSPKAEPFKCWLAKVGKERLDEIADPEKAFDRAMKTYLQKGYSRNWINQRLKSIEVRKDLTDEWQTRGVKEGLEFAILTDEITKAWAGMSVKGYKKHKNLKKESLRDNMTNLELVLNMLAEASTAEISKKRKPSSFVESKQVAKEGGSVAGVARKKLEERIGENVISSKNYLLKEQKKLS